MPDPTQTPEALKRLVERLQSPFLPAFDDCREAAAAISALMAERDALAQCVDRLTEALRRISDMTGAIQYGPERAINAIADAAMGANIMSEGKDEQAPG